MSTPTTGTAAFFDFDRTIVDGDAGVRFARELLRLKRRRLRDDRRGTIGWAARNLDYETRTLALFAWAAALTVANRVGIVKRSRLVGMAYGKMRGLRKDELESLAKDYFEDVLAQRILPGARQEMERHRREGRRIVVVSTGMEFVISPARRHLPIDEILAVHLEETNGVLNGKSRGPLWGREKADAVRAWAHTHDVSLPKSYAYTDHHSDLDLLRLVGNPVAVNPDRRLRFTARRKGWPIEDWPLAVAGPG